MIEIQSVEREIEIVDYVTTNELIYNTYRRTAGYWEVLMGESWESVFPPSADKLEKLFQEFENQSIPDPEEEATLNCVFGKTCPLNQHKLQVIGYDEDVEADIVKCVECGQEYWRNCEIKTLEPLHKERLDD